MIVLRCPCCGYEQTVPTEPDYAAEFEVICDECATEDFTVTLRAEMLDALGNLLGEGA